MPRILGLEMTGKQIVYRMLEAVVLSMLAFVLLFYIPSVLPSTISGFVTVTAGGLGSALLSKLIQPTAPTLGLFVVLLVFAAALLRGTRIYGLLLALNGLAFILYVFSLFQGGTVQVQAVGNAFGASGATLSLSLDLNLMMLAFLVPPILTVVKGFLLMRRPPVENTVNSWTLADESP
jgi:hypothetical protein